jgi:hypothetical protein
MDEMSLVLLGLLLETPIVDKQIVHGQGLKINLRIYSSS